jgi:low affinity Fe/Cu permease
VRKHFADFSCRVAGIAGSPPAFILALAVILIWAISGPIFHFSDTWQLIINTGTTIVTFLMVFLIQNTQNRDTRAMHLKLDELLRAVQGAREREFIDLETKDERQVERTYQKLVRETQPNARPSTASHKG